jgi:hypothetical protein
MILSQQQIREAVERDEIRFDPTLEERQWHETSVDLRLGFKFTKLIAKPSLGSVDHLSEGQKQLIRRAATLSIMAEAMEADAVRNLAFDGEAYGVLCDRLGRCLQRLGLERKPRDVTPDLKSYLEAKDRPA